MAIKSVCPGCRKVMSLADRLAGMSGRCKHCGCAFVIPGGPKGFDRESPDKPSTGCRPSSAPVAAPRSDAALGGRPIAYVETAVVAPHPSTRRPAPNPPADLFAAVPGELEPPIDEESAANREDVARASRRPLRLALSVMLALAAPSVAIGLVAATLISGHWGGSRRTAGVRSLVKQDPPPKELAGIAPGVKPVVQHAVVQPAVVQAVAPPPRRGSRVYVSPQNGPESIIRMSLDWLDVGQRTVVERLKSIAPDPERTSLVELLPTGRSADDIPDRRHAVCATLRAPNEFGAMITDRVLVYFDEAMHVTGTENSAFLADPFLYRILRRYYKDVPKSEGEKRNEAIMQGLIDMANPPQIKVPRPR